MVQTLSRVKADPAQEGLWAKEEGLGEGTETVVWGPEPFHNEAHCLYRPTYALKPVGGPYGQKKSRSPEGPRLAKALNTG